ncbi:unnamed protein product [Callosobruchus maculatus]|uniref:Cytochrome b5 n=1 Tax=Callosobruchus maculatus TaxID=64391 RepID=A0A653DME5_CALMS|nr:unnamed protein product [Callosobruchus maculatus]
MATKQYSLAEVKNHKDKNSTWLVIHNSVYDVTPFLLEHPGGEDSLLEKAGKDATEAFEDVGHTSDAREMMIKYKIWELIEADRIDHKSKNNQEESTVSRLMHSTCLRCTVAVTLGVAAVVLFRLFYKN